MKTAKEYLTERLGENKYKELLVNQGIEGWVIAAVNNSRKEAIKECADKIHGTVYNGVGSEMQGYYKQSILSLIDELK
jgi:hypothetical protein